MKIEGPGSPRSSGAAKRTSRPDKKQGEAFARSLNDSADAQETAAPAPALAPRVGTLLAVQEVGDALSGPSRARARAQARADAMLDKLDEIRIGLLAGTMSRSALTELTRLVESQRDAVDDPHLTAVLDEIDLRAQVELAKLSRQG